MKKPKLSINHDWTQQDWEDLHRTIEAFKVRVAARASDDKCHPSVAYWNYFFDTNDDIFEISTLGIGTSPRPQEYLRNRIQKAFMAGWDCKEQDTTAAERL